jgi:nucleotide-binding universal stress UspA family protein
MSATKPTYVVAFDFSISSRTALETAARDLEAMGGGTLVVAHAVEMPFVPVTGTWPGMDAPSATTVEIERTIDDETRLALLREVRLVEKSVKGVTFDIDLVRGPPVESLLASVASRGATRVVMGTHGRTGVAHVLLGSVAERVARLSPVPVLIVKAPKGAKD